jgi:hypothetical protein
MSEPLWTPEKTRAAQTTLGAFSSWLSSRAGKSFAGYDDLHRYSTVNSADFWSPLWDFASILGDKGNPPCLADGTCCARTAPAPPGRSGARTRSSSASVGTRARGSCSDRQCLARNRRARGKPGGGYPTQYAGSDRQRPCHGLDRRDVVLLLARLRRAGRARRLRPVHSGLRVRALWN